MNILEKLNMLYWIDFVDRYIRDNKKVDITVKFKIKKRFKNYRFNKRVSTNDWWHYIKL